MNILFFKLSLFADSQSSDILKADDFMKKIFPNFWDFLVQLIAFVILILLITKFGYKPIKQLLDERKNYVKQNLDGSLKAKQEAEEACKIASNEIASSKKRASLIIEEAKNEALKEREKILQTAKEDAKKEKEKADEDIALARKAAKESVQKEIVDVALKASSQLLGREVTTKDNTKLVEDFVTSMREDD